MLAMRRIFCNAGAVGMVLLLVGCLRTQHEYMEPVRPYSYGGEPESSLFPSDQDRLDDESFQRIMSARVVLPTDIRIAVLEHDSRDHVALAPEYLQSFMLKLEEDPRVARVTLMPSMLVPGPQTLPKLREAAARYQADLLFVYRISTQDLNAYRTFGKDQHKRYVAVEAILLDVRTGLVPLASVAVGSTPIVELKDQLAAYEARRDADAKAVEDALAKIIEELTAFLRTIPQLPPAAPEVP